MNAKQATVLTIAILAAILLVSLPRTFTRPRLVSTQRQANGGIVTTYQTHVIPWQPALFAVVVLVSGVAIFRLRTVRG